MEFTVITPKGILYHVLVDKASFPGSGGTFTVMRNHAPILSTLKKGKIIYNLKGEAEEKELDVEDGIVEVKQNKIRIFTEQ